MRAVTLGNPSIPLEELNAILENHFFSVHTFPIPKSVAGLQKILKKTHPFVVFLEIPDCKSKIFSFLQTCKDHFCKVIFINADEKHVGLYSSMGYQVVGRIIFPDFEEELDPLICGTTGGRRRIGKRSQDLFRNERARVVLQKLFLPCGKDIQLIDLDEVSFIQAGKGKSWVIFQDGRKEKTQLKFSQIRRMLTGGSFVQVNENTLINSRQVKFFERESHEMRPQPQQFAVLENGERITVIPSLRGGLFAKISEWQLDQ